MQYQYEKVSCFLGTLIPTACIQSNLEWICTWKAFSVLLRLSLGKPKYKKITRTLILCPERLNSLNARKIKYAHQQDTNSWSDGKIVNCFYQQVRLAHTGEVWGLFIYLFHFIQRSLDNIYSHTVSELQGQRDFSSGIIRLEASHTMAENKIRNRKTINIVPVHGDLDFCRTPGVLILDNCWECAGGTGGWEPPCCLPLSLISILYRICHC